MNYKLGGNAKQIKKVISEVNRWTSHVPSDCILLIYIRKQHTTNNYKIITCKSQSTNENCFQPTWNWKRQNHKLPSTIGQQWIANWQLLRAYSKLPTIDCEHCQLPNDNCIIKTAKCNSDIKKTQLRIRRLQVLSVRVLLFLQNLYCSLENL